MAAAVERDYGAADYWERRYYAEPPPLDLYLGYEDRACRALVAHMQHRYGAKDRLEYREADCRDLRAFDESAYDLVLDKALFDCVLCGSQNLSGVALMTAEALRVLKPGGAYVVVSHGAPDAAGYSSGPLDWRVSIVPVQKPRIAAEPQRADRVPTSARERPRLEPAPARAASTRVRSRGAAAAALRRRGASRPRTAGRRTGRGTPRRARP
ncbi:methyltransferase [Aureococcus anophagefferens]|nr:methyltransferase [Aureococcus anophagefferens]